LICTKGFTALFQTQVLKTHWWIRIKTLVDWLIQYLDLISLSATGPTYIIRFNHFNPLLPRFVLKRPRPCERFNCPFYILHSINSIFSKKYFFFHTFAAQKENFFFTFPTRPKKFPSVRGASRE